jgi:TonB family protein
MLRRLAIVFFCCSSLSGADINDAIQLVQQGTESVALTLPSDASYRLGITVTLKALKDGDIEGTYVRVVDHGKKRIDLKLGPYRELYMNDGKEAWHYRNSERPFRVLEALQPLSPRTLKNPLGDIEVKQINEKVGDENLQCVVAKPKSGETRKWCFDPATKLLRWIFDRRPLRFEFTDYKPFGQRQYPRTIRSYEASQLVAALTVTELEVSSPAPELFAPLRGMEQGESQLGCGPTDANDDSIIKKVQPQYPVSARRSGREGTVMFHAHIDKDGRVGKLTTLQSPPHMDLQDAARTAVQQWQFKPFTACGQPMAYETVITVSFELRP